MNVSLRRTFPATFWVVSRLTSRRAVMVCLAVLVVTGCTVLGIHVRAVLFRHAAGTLLQSIKTLRPNASGSGEVNAIVSRYKGVERKCVAADCVYTITLQQTLPLGDRLYRWKPNVAYAWYGLAPFIGFRETRLAASITVSSGVVAGKSYEIETWNPSGYWLIARARTVSSFPLHTSSLLDLHPNHLFWRPSGCKPCIATYADVTPSAIELEFQQAFDIDLSCVSRLVPCSEMVQFMPSATRERLHEENTYDWSSVRTPCNGRTIERYGRDSKRAALVRVKGLTPAKSRSDYGQLTYELVRGLKGTMPLHADMPIAGVVDVSGFSRGSDVIAFVDDWFGVSEECGLVPASEQNLKLTERGILTAQRSSLLPQS